MQDQATPRALPERSGKHRCTKCLALIPVAEFLRNDHICDACAEEEAYPLASTPEPQKKKKG